MIALSMSCSYSAKFGPCPFELAHLGIWDLLEKHQKHFCNRQ